MIFRKFIESDSEQILRILSQVWEIECIEKNILKDFFKNDNQIYVIENNDSIIACATLHIQKKLIHNGCKAGFLEEVVVVEEFRGIGVGEFLIKELIRISKEIGCYKLVLSCYPNRINFYEKCGFKKECTNMRIDIKN